MKLNILTLKNKVEEIINFDQLTEISLKNLVKASTDKKDEARVYGNVTREGSIYTVHGFVDVTISLLCDRCMDTVDTVIHAPLFYEFSTDEKILLENEDIKPITNSSIDLYDAIIEAIAMDMPMKVLCNEDCKGMCKGCGINLNKEACKCEALDIDPRLEQLKNIFG